MGVLVPGTLTADARPCPPLVPATVSDGRTLRYFTYSAGFTHSGISRNPWSQRFGWCGYFTYRAHMCNTSRRQRLVWRASTGEEARRLRPEGYLRWLEVTAEIPGLVTVNVHGVAAGPPAQPSWEQCDRVAAGGRSRGVGC